MPDYMSEFPKVNPTQTEAWKALEAHFNTQSEVRLQDLFGEDAERAQKFSLTWDDFYLDYSKNHISQQTLTLLKDLANQVQLNDAIKAQFEGAAINQTEGRAVLHTALRDFTNPHPEVQQVLAQMQEFSQAIISGQWKGHTGKAITTVVNIGIGGSDLGPDMVVEGLRHYRNHLELQFISNIEGDHVHEVLKTLDPETTVFIIVSKSFTTQETLANANTVRSWFLKAASEAAIAKHFVAVSTNTEAVVGFGMAPENIFTMWDWVGGRFSLWSAVGLSVCCAVGFDHFKSLLVGAHKMDQHFSTASFDKNMPVLLALISVWYNNFFKVESEAVIPYTQYLTKLVPYLQQAVMESNGKNVDRNGEAIDYQTGTIVWGSTGTNAQHAFFQLLHQGTKLIPADFIAFKKDLFNTESHQEALLANFVAQTQALMQGTEGQAIENPYRVFKGNRPTNTILIEKLTPQSLGSLIALYEHKLFVQGVIWNIYSYDQWGVQLGKVLANNILEDFAAKQVSPAHDSSTKGILDQLI